jgi:hypothetical protein
MNCCITDWAPDIIPMKSQISKVGLGSKFSARQTENVLSCAKIITKTCLEVEEFLNSACYDV